MTTQSWLPLVGVYLHIAALWSISWIFVEVACRFNPQRAGQWLFVARSLIVASFCLPILLSALPRSEMARPSAQVWSGTERGTGNGYTLVSPVVTPQSGSPADLSGIRLMHWQVLAGGLMLLAGVLIGLVWTFFAYRKLDRFLLRQTCLHRIGRTRVLASQESDVAFSVRRRNIAYIVLPHALLTVSGGEKRLVMAHEAQHHRQFDTAWAPLLALIRAFCFWNPAVFLLLRRLVQLQEFACDEVLIGRRGFSPQEYGRCLLQAAKSALNPRPVLVGTTGMASSRSGQFLLRRITMLFENQKAKRSSVYLSTVGALVLLASVALGAHSAIQGRSLSSEVAKAAAEKAAKGSAIPVELNELVMKYLEHFTGSPEGRKHMKGALERLPQYREMLDRKFAQYKMPPELVAIPLAESAMRNDAVSPKPHYSAGIWQFIAPTARRYGLRSVDGPKERIFAAKDERLNPELETDAAMKYLGDLHKQFGDWRLAIKAYNEGEVKVARLVAAGGSDAWALERRSSRASYLSGVIAALIVYKNPELLD